MTDPAPAIFARFSQETRRVEADSGPSEFWCRKRHLFMLCLDSGIDFVPVIGCIGGRETWACFGCERLFVVTWRKPAENAA